MANDKNNNIRHMGKSNTNPTFRKANVLIADDNQEFLHILERRVKKMGHAVDVVEDGNAAVEKIKNNTYDLLIVDYSMPGKTGLGVIETIKDYRKHMQVIIVTGSDSIDIAVEALRYRVFDFLRKPLSSLLDFEKTVTQALVAGFNEEEAAQEIEENLRMATTEPLTGLRNRHKLEEDLDGEIDIANRGKLPMCIMMLDLDDFKHFNDIHGHVAGDEVLKTIGEVIQIAIRKEDIPFRFGGDEFLIILPNTKPKAAKKTAERIIFLSNEKEVNGEPLNLSIGISEWHAKLKDSKEMITQADKALYESKHDEKQKISIFK